MRHGATAGTSAATEDALPDGGWRRQRRCWPTGRRRGGRGDGATPLPGSGNQGSVPDPPRPTRGPRGRLDWCARELAGAPERARQATADRAPRGGCRALRAGRFLPLVCNDRLGGLNRSGGNYLHWLVTARVNSHLGKLGPGDGCRPLRTKGDDGGRHRRRRQVNRVSMSWRFDRPDFPDLESHSGCRASGRDGRYFLPSEMTPPIVVLHLALRVSPDARTRCVSRIDNSLGIKSRGTLVGCIAVR